jgi:sugar lactone lactonase YvrE
MKVEQISDAIASHGEGPVWSERWGGLKWVDMTAGDVLTLRPDGSVSRRHVSDVVAAVRPRRSGGMALGVERGYALVDADGKLTRLAELWQDESIRMNDGGCDPDGRFYCGSMSIDRVHGAGSLYRLDPDRSVELVLDQVTISNGLDWSPDGSLAYYNDTETHVVSVFEYDVSGGLHDRRAFASVSPDVGRPDGLTVDSEGFVWVALSGGGAVHRYSPAGALDGVVEIPTMKVTACAFGGPRLDQLFVTTTRENLRAGEDPLAGSLFRADVGVRGLPVREFAG